jgi:hypothetical protein
MTFLYIKWSRLVLITWISEPSGIQIVTVISKACGISNSKVWLFSSGLRTLHTSPVSKNHNSLSSQAGGYASGNTVQFFSVGDYEFEAPENRLREMTRSFREIAEVLCRSKLSVLTFSGRGGGIKINFSPFVWLASSSAILSSFLIAVSNP